MKTYRITIRFFNGSVKRIQANKAKLQKAGNVCNYCALKFVESRIKRITISDSDKPKFEKWQQAIHKATN